MTVSDILLIEDRNTDAINLFKEGIFWRTYNRSAMWLCMHLKPCKVTGKFIKKEKRTIFYCGFPESSLDKIKQQAIEKNFQIIAANEKLITIKGVLSNDNYQIWEEKQNFIVKEPAVQYGKKSDNIIQQIQHYPLENSTPMETMLFVQKLKQSITDGIIL